METIIAGIIVLVAFVWVVRSIVRAACGKDEGCRSRCGGGCCGGNDCGRPDAGNEPRQDPGPPKPPAA